MPENEVKSVLRWGPTDQKQTPVQSYKAALHDHDPTSTDELDLQDHERRRIPRPIYAGVYVCLGEDGTP